MNFIFLVRPVDSDDTMTLLLDPKTDPTEVEVLHGDVPYHLVRDAETE